MSIAPILLATCPLGITLLMFTIVFKVLREGQSQFPPFTMKAVLIAVFCGLCACFGILTFQNGVRYGRITTSWLIVNLSALLPTAMSFIIYDEFKRMKWQHPVALVLTTVSVLLLWKDKKREASPLEVEPSRASTLPRDREPLVSAVQE